MAWGCQLSHQRTLQIFSIALGPPSEWVLCQQKEIYEDGEWKQNTGNLSLCTWHFWGEGIAQTLKGWFQLYPEKQTQRSGNFVCEQSFEQREGGSLCSVHHQPSFWFPFPSPRCTAHLDSVSWAKDHCHLPAGHHALPPASPVHPISKEHPIGTPRHIPTANIFLVPFCPLQLFTPLDLCHLPFPTQQPHGTFQNSNLPSSHLGTELQASERVV